MLAAAQAQKVPKIMRDKDGKPYVGDTIPPDKLPQGPTQDEAKYMDTLETLRDQQLRQLKTQREYDLWLQTFTSDDALEKGWASKYKPDYQGIDEFESKSILKSIII